MKETFDPFVEEQEYGRGPRGGNLAIPYAVGSKPEWRVEHFGGESLGDGTVGLHRFDKGHDTASLGRKNEQPWHRMAAYMLNAGRTSSEIALAAEVSVAQVTTIRSQRWFQELCATIANTTGEEIMGALKGYALESIEAIHDIAKDSKSDRVKLSAHLAILEHAHGKPVQKIVSDISHRVATSPTEEMESIQSELAALRSSQPKPLELPVS